VNEFGDNDQAPLIFRMVGPDGVTPAVLVQLDVTGFNQVLTGVLRPDLAHSVIAAQWAAGLELSAGAGAIAQLSKTWSANEALWGPAQLVTPKVDPALDNEIDEQGNGGFLLGHDFLEGVWVAYVGPARLVVVSWPPEGDD